MALPVFILYMFVDKKQCVLAPVVRCAVLLTYFRTTCGEGSMAMDCHCYPAAAGDSHQTGLPRDQWEVRPIDDSIHWRRVGSRVHGCCWRISRASIGHSCASFVSYETAFDVCYVSCNYIEHKYTIILSGKLISKTKLWSDFLAVYVFADTSN